MTVRALVLGVRFLCELALLAALAWWGFAEVGWWAGVGAPLAAAAVWGVFVSPKAQVRLPVAARVPLELLLFALGTLALLAVGAPLLALPFAVAAAATSFANALPLAEPEAHPEEPR